MLLLALALAADPAAVDAAVGQSPWRCIGPANMGGRVTALAVNDADPTTYYVATASGGLLKTTNNGSTFEHLFDREGTVSLGDVAVSRSHPSVVWVGTGEANPRNSVSYGDGVSKSTDGGKTWKRMGLDKTFQVGRIAVHPTNPDVVYVAALGRLYGPNPDRGVFKTADGGKTWSKVLFVDDNTGAVDVKLDPFDPETLLAATWERRRDAFDGYHGDAPPVDRYGPAVTHAAGSGLYKSTDGGKTWRRLNDPAKPNGLPAAKLGRVGLSYSAKTRGRVAAVIDTEKVGTGEVRIAYLGVVGANAPDKGGSLLEEVTPGGPAEKAGLRADDIITAVDGKKVATHAALVEHFQGKQPGDKLKLTVRRDGKDETIAATLGERKPDPKEAPQPPVSGVRFVGATLTLETVFANGPATRWV